MRPCYIFTLVLTLGLPGMTRAADKSPPDVGIDQRLGDLVPLDLPFRDEAGHTVTLGECIDGKPTILVMAYYRCPMLCTQVLNGLLDALRGIPYNIGDRFNVVTVSFDPRERPILAAAKKAQYTSEYGRSGAGGGWHFLTGQELSIKALAQAVGFRYEYDAGKNQFAHASGIMVLTPKGRLARYFYGIDYPSRDLRLGLVEASEGTIGSPVEQILLLCFHYDPATGKYTAAVMNLVRLGGTLTLLAIGSYFAVNWWRDRRRPAVITS